MDTSDLGFFSKELAVAIGVYEAIVFNKLQWCVETSSMNGKFVDEQKWIRNPIECTSAKKQEEAQGHGKAIETVKAIHAKLPKARTKREQILAANIAELADSTRFVRKPIAVQPKPVVVVEDDSILW